MQLSELAALAAQGAMTVDAAVKGCCESCKKPNAVGWRGCPCVEASLKFTSSLHVVTFVKSLAHDQRRHIVFKMGQAGNGEKP
jgi:hypothetical protein